MGEGQIRAQVFQRERRTGRGRSQSNSTQGYDPKDPQPKPPPPPPRPLPRLEDADALGQALHLAVVAGVLVVGGGGREHQVGGVGQGVLLGKLLPAVVVALVGDVALAQLGLQLAQVQPRLVVLGERRKRTTGEGK